MKARSARVLTRMYPKSWRARYGPEFAAFLENYPASPLILLDIARGALREFAFLFAGGRMDRLRRSFVLIAYAWLAAMAAGMNLYWTVDDSPLVLTMRSHLDVSVCWDIVEAGALLAFLAVLAGGLPLILTMFRFATNTRRRDILVRLLFPAFAVMLIVIWFAVVLAWNGGHWAPMPWAILGDGPGWPDIHSRWILGSVTLVLLVSTLIGSAICFEHAVRRSEFTQASPRPLASFWQKLNIQPLQLARMPSIVLAASTVIMAAAILGWGVLVNEYAAIDFHRQSGGILATTTFSSWLISFILLVAASVTATRAARPILAAGG